MVGASLDTAGVNTGPGADTAIDSISPSPSRETAGRINGNGGCTLADAHVKKAALPEKDGLRRKLCTRVTVTRDT